MTACSQRSVSDNSFLFFCSICLLLVRRFAFMSAQNGLVLRLALDNLLDTSVPAATAPVAPLFTLNARELLRGGASLPRWIRLLRNQETRARLHGVCALPIVPSVIGSDGRRNFPAPWQQE